jgi:hypothetical protein
MRVFNNPRARRSRGQPSNDEKELLRSAVVFAIAALDALLHDLVLEVVPERGTVSQELNHGLREIAKRDPALALRVSLAPDRQAARGEFQEALNSWLSSQTFHGPKAVVQAAAYAGCSFAWGPVDANVGASAAERLDHFTNMRHEIVHRGRKPRIQRGVAQECIDLINSVAIALRDQTSGARNGGR